MRIFVTMLCFVLTRAAVNWKCWFQWTFWSFTKDINFCCFQEVRIEGQSDEQCTDPVKSDKNQLPLVSILTPTREKTQSRHPLLYNCFAHQTYPHRCIEPICDVIWKWVIWYENLSGRELLVLDDSPAPSIFFTTLKNQGQDPRVTYIHVQVPHTEYGGALRR